MAAKQFSLFDEPAQSRTSKIYVWFCPLTDSAVYVGKTSMTMGRRWSGHKSKSLRKPKTRKEHWLKNILEMGLMPRIEVIEEVSVEDSSEREVYWALKYGVDSDLLNCDFVGAGNPGVGRVNWTPEIIAMLGKVPDSEIAKIVGCTPKTVSYRREILGINLNRPNVSRSKISSDRSGPGVTRVEWEPEIIALMGKLADGKIAKIVGCQRKTVSYRRKILGICASIDMSGVNGPPPMGGHNKIDLPFNIIDLLGTMPDYKLAEIAGCHKKVIGRVRNERGIDCYAKTAGKPFCKPKKDKSLGV